MIAGLWDGQVLNAASAWRDFSRDVYKAEIEDAVVLWVMFMMHRDEDTGEIGLLTTGLARFAGRELQFTTGPDGQAGLVAAAASLAAYLVQHGPVIRDGATFGSDSGERIVIRHEGSTLFGGLPVLAARIPG